MFYSIKNNTYFQTNTVWRPKSLSEITPFIFNIELTHFGSEASIHAQIKTILILYFFGFFYFSIFFVHSLFCSMNKSNRKMIITKTFIFYYFQNNKNIDIHVIEKNSNLLFSVLYCFTNFSNIDFHLRTC